MHPDGTAIASWDFAASLAAEIARLPDWAWNLAVPLLAVALALGCGRIVAMLADRARDSRRIFLANLLTQARGPIRLALVIFALDATLPTTRLDVEIASATQHALLIAFIALMGWIAIVAAYASSPTGILVQHRPYRIHIAFPLLSQDSPMAS